MHRETGRVARERRIGARLALWGTRYPRPALADLRRAWRVASEAERIQFLAEVEELPY